MATFSYTARKRDGQKVVGTLQADTESAALRLLDERQLFPIEVREQADAGAPLIASSGRVSNRQLALVYSQLADLLGAGVPLLSAINTVARTLRAGALRSALTAVGEQVANGSTLADAMAEQPGAFRSLHVAMVRAGERGGFIEEVLVNLAAFLERQDELRNKVIGSLVYPVILVAVGVGVVCFLMVFLVPRFESMLTEQAALPLPSQVLFAVSGFLVEQWPLVLLLGAAGVGGVIAVVRSAEGQRLLALGAMYVPVVGMALRMLAITRFCRIFGTLLANGVPILQALSISRDAAGLPALGEAIDTAAENVRKGEPMTQPLRDSELFPGEVLEMIHVAEESNQMEKTLLKIADTVERRTERQVDLAVRLVEPVVLIFIAAAIGLVALGILMPIFNMASSLRGG